MFAFCIIGSFEAKRNLLGSSDLEKYLEKNEFSIKKNWTEYDSLVLPIPKTCSVVNILSDTQAEEKHQELPTTIEYWDEYGNYFMKSVKLSAQGGYSLNYPIKNQAVDFDDAEIKFGNWVSVDSFHIKKFYQDVFRGQCIVAYWLTEQVYQTRPYGERRPWDYLNSIDSVETSTGEFSRDFDNFNSEGLAHPDGFPIKVFFNGKNAGVYAFCLKKSRENYNLKKKNQKHILLDGAIDHDFFTANGNVSNSWTMFEVKNPKISKDIEGNDYDGDHPKEPSDDYMEAKDAIRRLSTAVPVILSQPNDEMKKAKFAEFFNVPFIIDYDLISEISYNWDGYSRNWIWITNDGLKWTPTSYDLDSSFGILYMGINGSYIQPNPEILGTWDRLPTGDHLLKGLYRDEMKARYKELRDKNIFTTRNIIGLFEEWIKRIGYDNLKEDIEKIVLSPYIENGKVVNDSNGDPILIPSTPTYRDDRYLYKNSPREGGCYNSIRRVKNWLNARIEQLDEYFNYSQISTPTPTPMPSLSSSSPTKAMKNMSSGSIVGIVTGSVGLVIAIIVLILVIRKKNDQESLVTA